MAFEDIMPQATLDKTAAMVLGVQPQAVRDYFEKLFAWLDQAIRKAICQYGLTEIDSEEERKELAKKIADAVCKLIPAPYNMANPVIRPIVRYLAKELLDEAASQGEAFCANVSPDPLLPFALE